MMAAIDSGHLQGDVLNFTRSRERRGIIAIKGASQRDRPIISRASTVDFNWRGKVIRSGARQWQVGVDTAKNRLWHILKQDRETPPSSRRLHFSAELDESFYVMFTAEVYDPNKRKWIKTRQRNESLDCYCYAIAASQHPSVRIHRWTDAQWKRQEEMIQPVNGDLFAPQEALSAPPRPKKDPDWKRCDVL